MDEQRYEPSDLLTWIELTGSKAKSDEVIQMLRQTSLTPENDLCLVFQALAESNFLTLYNIADSVDPIDAGWLEAMCVADLGNDVELKLMRNPLVSEVGKDHIRTFGFQAQTAQARNPDSTPEQLMVLANSRHVLVQIDVAHNLNTPSETLVLLSQHEDSFVRDAVAGNPNTPEDVLRHFVSNDIWILKNVVTNPATPADVLEILCRAEDSDIRKLASLHPNTPVAALSEMVDDDAVRVRATLARNPRTPADVLKVLAGDRLPYVRGGVVENPSTPDELLQRIADEGEPGMQQRALEVLAGRKPVEGEGDR